MRRLIFTISTLALLGAGLTATAQKKEPKVLFIGIDGLRYDALKQANTPNMDQLAQNGLYTYDSWHCGITSSGPSWSSMMTGVWEQKHKVTSNSYNNADFATFPYFPTRAKECDPNLKAVEIITWDPMNDPTNSNNTAGYVYNSGFNQSIDAGTYGQGAVTAAAKIQLQDADLDILFIHYDECDAAGHGSGFSPTNPAYMNAVQQVDKEIGEVVAALKARANYANEDWMILLTTDHGGVGTGHGGNTNTERHIWWMASGDNIPNMEITGDDPGSYQMATNPVDTTKLKATPVLTDIAVTALAHVLKYNATSTCSDPETNPKWQLDGKSWMPKTTSSYVLANPNASIDFGIYPNPNNGDFKVAFRGVKGDIAINVVNVSGQTVFNNKTVANDGLTVVPVSLSAMPKGVYFLEVSHEGKTASRKVVLQ